MKYEILSSSHSIRARFRNACALCRRGVVSVHLHTITHTSPPVIPVALIAPSTNSSSLVQPLQAADGDEGTSPSVPTSRKKKSGAQVESLVIPNSCRLKPDGNTKKKSETQKRPGPIPVRASEDQRAILKVKAKAAGLALSRYILAAALGSNYTQLKEPELIRELHALNRELTAQGNNLNQIAKHLNSGTVSPVQGERMLDSLGNSMLQTHRAVRRALAQGKPEP